MPRQRPRMRMASLALLLLAAGALAQPLPTSLLPANGTAAPPPLDSPPLAPPAVAAPALEILWDQQLSSDPSPATDVRWAGERSVYVAWMHHGASQLSLDGNFTALRNLFPDVQGFMRSPYLPFDHLAVSDQYVVASSLWNTLGFRPLHGSQGMVLMTKVPVGIVDAIDLAGSRLVLLGIPTSALPKNGAIAWLGPLTGYPGRDLKPLLYDAGGAKYPTFLNCAALQLGKARFLGDGSLLVVPGTQPGAHLFDAAGNLLRTWDTSALGIDGDAECPGITPDESHRLYTSERARFDYINRHRVLDAILPLAQGPGLLIRSVAAGTVHWQLKVPQGLAILTYDLPLTGTPPYDRLHGDVRGDRIVLLRTGNPDKPYGLGHLWVAKLPRIESPPVTRQGVQP
jgi:hypothetical protein